MTRTDSDAPPFSYMVKVGHVSHNPIHVRVQADDSELKALAQLWKVPAVGALSAELQVRRWKKDGVKVFGVIKGHVTQTCVVTLEPVDAEIHEDVDQIFVPEGSSLLRAPGADQAEMIVDPEGPDLPDIFQGDAIDIGAMVAELAAMGLDPYPRKQGAEFADHIESTVEQDAKPSPFAVLKNMKLDK
jgi:uncharacterized metal-binding protein YceD (DUF177 family)